MRLEMGIGMGNGGEDDDNGVSLEAEVNYFRQTRIVGFERIVCN
jgi:hypothetical protein